MADAIVNTKRCCHCKQTKPHGEFFKNRANRDGLQFLCKKCMTDAHLRYVRTPKGWKAHSAGHLRYKRTEKAKVKARNLGRQPARSAVRSMIRAGKMPAASTLRCKHCGKPAKGYHHHNGYELEHHLDVIPLCVPCHRKADHAMLSQVELVKVPVFTYRHEPAVPVRLW